MIITCPYCKKEVDKHVGHVNRANKLGVPIYCGKPCSALARKDNKTIEQKKAEKAEYDKQYRTREKAKETKKRYNETPAGRASQKRNREKMKQYHLEYCRQEEYRKNKVKYDQEHRAKKNYGEFWESAILLEEIDKHIASKADKQHLRVINGTLNKSKRRKKQWLRLLKNLPQLT